MSLNLKHIPCPAGGTCTAFQCVFGHERDKPKPVSPTPRTALQPPKRQPTFSGDGTQEHYDDYGQPRKRLKTTQDSRSFQQRSGSIRESDQTEAHQTLRDNMGKDMVSSSALDSATREVSPPPLKRNAYGTTDSSHPPLSKLLGNATASPNKALTPQKAETLNPRLVKAAPAQHEVRLKLLKMLHAELKRLNGEMKKDAKDDEARLLLNDQELIQRALDMEENLATSKGAVYNNVMKQLVVAYKRKTPAEWKTEQEKEVVKKRQKEDQTTQGSDTPVVVQTGLSPVQELKVLGRLVTPVGDLSQFGYVPVRPTDQEVQQARDGVEAAGGYEKCDRCGVRFQVFPGRRQEDGALTSGGACVFHPGRLRVPYKAPGDKTRKARQFTCCNQEVGESTGCDSIGFHVYKVESAKRLAATFQFEHTPENQDVPDDRVVCFDCEMGYTTHGMEVIRVTATSWPDGVLMLDALVRPFGEVLDLNSRYSGVRPEDMHKAKEWIPGSDEVPSDVAGYFASLEQRDTENEEQRDTWIAPSPKAARELLFSLIKPSTPLIGHGLENDLNTLRIIHPTLVDTILLYPARQPLPSRLGLKLLMDQHLHRKIQQELGTTGAAQGHDSAEDARAAGELVYLAVKKAWEEMKYVGWSLDEDGQFVMPAERKQVSASMNRNGKMIPDPGVEGCRW